MLKKSLFLVYLLLAVFVLLFASPEDFTQRATCECYYKFENAGDLGEDNQNQIDLTNNGVAQSATIPDDAQDFCGISATNSADFELSETDYMTATHAASVEVDDLTALTALCWVRFETVSIWGSIFDKRHANGQSGWYLYLGASNVFTTWFHDTANDFSTPGVDTWYFVAFVYDGTDLKGYFGTEAVQVSNINDTGTIGATAATTGPFVMGADWSMTTNYLDGLVCEAAVFSEVLDLSELEDIQEFGMEGAEEEGNAIFFGMNFLCAIFLFMVPGRLIRRK